MVSRRSEWLRRVPTTPASLTARGETEPVNFPIPSSMCWAKTGVYAELSLDIL